MPHERFAFPTLAHLVAKAGELAITLPVTDALTSLSEPLVIGELCAPNRFAVQPMEGCDGTPDGKPDILTIRRYERFYRGGAGLIWYEATAIAQEGRANPRQLYLDEANCQSFQDLLEHASTSGRQVNGVAYRPYTVLQLTHSGRYSRPADQSTPVIAHHDGVLDAAQQLPPSYPLVSDQELQALVPRYVQAARLAERAGFDGVDIKCCHRYLLNELLAAYTRPGNYGGSFENRTRLLLEIVRAVRTACPRLHIWTRLNCYDGHPYPWGWGVDRVNPQILDMSEPLQLIGLLHKAGVTGINVTAGNPYFTPFINRPYDQAIIGGTLPDEHPLFGVGRLLDLARKAKHAYPALLVIGSGFSWLRQYIPQVAAGALAQGWMDIAGIGRAAFAYPDLPRDVLRNGALNPKKACITCSRCSQIMRCHGRAGCAIFDREVYGPIYIECVRQHAAG